MASQASTAQLDSGTTQVQPGHLVDWAQEANDSHEYAVLAEATFSFFSSVERVNASFRPKASAMDPTFPVAASASELLKVAGDLCLDFEAVDSLYSALVSTQDRSAPSCSCMALLRNMVAGPAGHRSVTSGLIDGSKQLATKLSREMGRPALYLARQIAVLIINPLFDDLEHHDAALRVFQLINGLAEEHRKVITSSFLQYPTTYFTRVLVLLQQFITLSLYNDPGVGRRTLEAVQVLDMLYKANEVGHRVPAAAFYNDYTCGEDFNLKVDYQKYKQGRTFSFCQYPFMYDPAIKAEILHLEHYQEQMMEVQVSFCSMLMEGRLTSIFFSLNVRRGDHMVRDTMVQLNRAQNGDSLKKPLKVRFVGEQGVDEGGVKKEFFQLLVRELFNPDYGMFVYDPETRLHWFQTAMVGDSLDADYEAVGILVGLAIYNQVILDFTFPACLYKKLMGMPLGLDDLAELKPEVWRSFNLLLQMQAEQLEQLGLSFQVETEGAFGTREVVPLLPNGCNIAVHSGNCHEYVSLYVKYLLESSVERQFRHFQKGFLRMCNQRLLSHFFRPEELESIICGGRLLDIESLAAHAIYEDGYDKNHEVIRWFWEVVHSFSPKKQKRLLSFVTGTDRVPIKGLAHLRPRFVISRSGPHSERLPTAHTCFNHLLLPEYKDKESLRDRLQLAIENAEGFGLI